MKKKALLIIAPVMVVVLGTIGYLQEGHTLYEAFLGGMDFLKVEFKVLPPNAFLEASRWLGVLFLFGIIYSAIIAIAERGVIFAKARRNDTVAVHGDSVYAPVLLSALGSRGIQSDSRMALNAPVQVLLFDDDRKALEFYQRNSDALKIAREVHICLNTACHANMKYDNVFVTDLSEIRSIDYWRANFCMEPETIAIIGSGSLPETVLYWALLTNVTDIDCSNSYLVFGKNERFRAVHGDISGIIRDYGDDSISFYSDEWYKHADELKKADRIILCGETMANVEAAHDMRSIGIKCGIHLFAENSSVSALADDSVTVVGTISKENIRQVLLMDSIHEAGRLCHATYMALAAHDVEDPDADYLKEFIRTDAFRRDWKSLDPFTRGSNYATAIHDPVKRDLLLKAGLDVKGLKAEENREQYERLGSKVKERLQEIEHIRWSRYHLLNNWKAPEGDIVIDGVRKQKDAANRLHECLVPYSGLSEEDKNKDAYYYQTLALRTD